MKRRSKLKLSKQTLRRLGSEEIYEINGGFISCTLCPTWKGSCISGFYPDGCWCAPPPV